MYDLIIVGAGPAGLTAAIYAKRAELDVLVVEKEVMSGGQIINTYEVDNYPGMPGTNGFDLAMAFRAHADKLGASFVSEEITKTEPICDREGKQVGYRLLGKKNTYETKTLLLAAGAKHRKLNVPGEDTLSGHGVSYCATCDGAFFRGKDVAVIGGGDVAVEDAIFLARLCRKVYVIHRREELRAAKSLQTALLALPNVEMVWNSQVKSVNGEKAVESLTVITREGEIPAERKLPVQGVFIAVGIEPLSAPFAGLADQDENGYIIAGEDGVTSAEGVFAAGDIRTTTLRQVVTAAADGANAAVSAERYIHAK